MLITVTPEKGIGPGGDLHYKKHESLPGVWCVAVGGVLFGEMHKQRWSGWTAISYNRDKSEFFNVNSMEGFANRYYASQFIIKHHGYWMENERERKIRMSELAKKWEGE